MDFYTWNKFIYLNSRQSEMTYLESLQQQEFRQRQIAHKNQRMFLHAGSELACMQIKKQSPALGLAFAFIGYRSAGNIFEAVLSALQMTDCACKMVIATK